MAPDRISPKGVAIPHEHGGWGAVLEPIIVGLVAVPSAASAFAGLLVFVAFLLRTPLRILLLDWRRGKHTDRTSLALRYFSIFALGFAVLLWLGLEQGRAGWWWPLAVAAPFGFVQLYFDIYNRGRELVPTVVGIGVLGAASTAMLLADGRIGWPTAGLPWLLLALKGLGAILFVKAQLLRRSPRPPRAWPFLFVHLTGLLVSVGYGLFEGQYLPAAAFALLTLRAVFFHLSAPRKVKTVGWTEILFGLVFSVFLGLGMR